MSHRQAKKLRKMLDYRNSFEPAVLTHRTIWSNIFHTYIKITNVAVCAARKQYQQTKKLGKTNKQVSTTQGVI